MRRLHIDDLPKTYKGTSWSESVGHIFDFEYDDIVGKIEILDFQRINNGSMLTIKCTYDDIEYIGNIRTSNLNKVKLGSILKDSHAYKHNIGDVVNGLKILKQIKLERNIKYKCEKGYAIKCVTCEEKYSVFETSLTKGCGCKYCKGNHSILGGVNDIATTHPHLIKYFSNEEDTHTYSYGSTKKVLMKCPDCGNEKYTKISDISNNRFSCPKCGDGISYPNKFMFNTLKQLNVEFVPEYSPEWISPKRYDFYIPSKNIIVEMDGGFHYEDNKMAGITVDNSRENDNEKDKSALENGISVIRVDSCESDCSYIKHNIFKSKINGIFNLSAIDWLKCHEFACSSRVKEACDLWNNGTHSTMEIAKIMDMEYSTIREYLKKGKKANMCCYGEELIKENKARLISKQKSKSVMVIETGEIFKSIVELSNLSKDKLGVYIDKTSIARVCRGERSHTRGFHFKYV